MFNLPSPGAYIPYYKAQTFIKKHNVNIKCGIKEMSQKPCKRLKNPQTCNLALRPNKEQ